MTGELRSPLSQIAGPAPSPTEGPVHLVVAGTIATGKTTLTKALAARFGLPAAVERPDTNPFLKRFYANQRRWALASQLWFATDSARQHAEIHRGSGGVQDHSIYENVHVFGAALAAHGALDEDEWDLLRAATAPVTDSLPPPSLVVLVEAPAEALLERIDVRGRPYETGIDHRYLTELTQIRREFFERWTRSPVLLLDSDATDLRQPGQTEIIAESLIDYLPNLK
jgi:deoxyadenosine/deoxycytidine kinase